MKTIGLIGGISWHSTTVYYKTINQQIGELLGDSHSAKLLLYSVNYNDFKLLQSKNDWIAIENMLSDIAMKIERAGADCIVLCCNTAHIIADELKQKIKIPLLHIANETAKVIVRQQINKVGLLGTMFTMGNHFFSNKLLDAGIVTIIPSIDEQVKIHAAILDEMSKGNLSVKSKELFRLIIRNLKEKGAEAIVFGCTELGMFLQQEDCELKIFDTTLIHSKAAVDFAISRTSNLYL